ncbi:MAG: peptidoglycan editing factor PgeF [Campylobacterales bacterium]|nr:peptidoglycan editing factor PgeF [Campylobacterales bacterium]
MGRGGTLDASVLVHFTNRYGGVSVSPYATNNLALHVKDNPLHVKENRRLTCKALSLPHVASMEQVHGTQVRVVEGQCTQTYPACDGLITKEKDVALMVLVADCIPVVLYDPKTEVIGALHVGRAGAFGGIVPHAIGLLQSTFGVEPSSLHVSLGPSIGGCCYEIGGEALVTAQKEFSTYLDGRYLNLQALVQDQLARLGVVHVESDAPCTCCDGRYFSYRREGQTGRQAGIILQRSESGK